MSQNYIDRLIAALKQSIVFEGREPFKTWEHGFEAVFSVFCEVKKKEQQVFFIGNGGSAAIASHMTADFMKNGGMRTVSLYDNALTTCMGNDYGYEYVFSKPLEFLAQKEDLLVAVSSSGNSKNIVNAIDAVRQKGSRVITFTGFSADNMVKQLGDLNVYVPVEHYGMVESVHNLLLQQVVDEIMERDGVRL